MASKLLTPNKINFEKHAQKGKKKGQTICHLPFARQTSKELSTSETVKGQTLTHLHI